MSYVASANLIAPLAENGLWLAISAWLGTSSKSTTATPTRPATKADKESRGVTWRNSSSASARTEAAAATAIRDLTRYATFHHGWDGYNGEVFNADVVARAIKIVETLAASFISARTEPGEITPGPISDGRIDVEATCGGRRLIITLESASDRVGVFYDDGSAPHEELARWNQDDMDRWIRRLTGEDRVSVPVRNASEH